MRAPSPTVRDRLVLIGDAARMAGPIPAAIARIERQDALALEDESRSRTPSPVRRSANRSMWMSEYDRQSRSGRAGWPPWRRTCHREPDAIDTGSTATTTTTRGLMTEICTHLETIKQSEGRTGLADCPECMIGSTWLHLRRCNQCGQVGCCDDGPNRQASAHHAAGHPIVRSLEPSEDRLWCYEDEVAFRLAED